MMLFKTSLLLVVVLAATTVAVPAAPPDPLMWIWEKAWPKSQKQQVPLPPARPKATRSSEHRKVHRLSPTIARREAVPLPRVYSPAPIIKDTRRERVTVKKHRVAARGGMPSCAHVKREYDRMTTAQRWAAYMAATSEQVAHGKRCLGF